MQLPISLSDKQKTNLIELLSSWGITELTEIQSLAIEKGITTGSSMIVSAPTSSGKTVIGELALYFALQKGMRALYLVSHRALADEKFTVFNKTFGDEAPIPITRVGLNTGDRSEGDIDSQLMIATYEKALGLILTGQINPNNICVVADELQIISDTNRGANIETLCTLLRKHGIKQFIALTATVANPESLSDWMGCHLVESKKRSTPLHQEIWYSGEVSEVTFGEYIITNEKMPEPPKNELLEIIDQLLNMERGPILVFTETRAEAPTYAKDMSEKRPVVGDGLYIAKQLELFAEPTEASVQLQNGAERRVAYHTADLSAQERSVIEEGFLNHRFDVCFATSTLAAGVNFPFKTVIFPKLSYRYREAPYISRSDYRNMSGRAGRLGMHSEGYAVLLARNPSEYEYAKKLVLPENDPVESRFSNISFEKTILELLASRVVSSFDDLLSFYQNTFYWHQRSAERQLLQSELESESRDSLQWLIANGLAIENEGNIFLTELGRGAAISGLLPSTVVSFSNLIHRFNQKLEDDFPSYHVGFLYCILSCDEFLSENPSRFLPPISKTSTNSYSYLSTHKALIPFESGDSKLCQATHALGLYIAGEAERKITYQTKITAGYIHRLALDVSWVIEGFHKIATLPNFGCSQGLTNSILQFARMVKRGVPVEALDFLNIADKFQVPGFGRQRTMSLLSNNLDTIEKILGSGPEKLSKIVGSEQRARALIDALSSSIGYSNYRLKSSHIRLSEALKIRPIVDACYRENNTEYENAIIALLQLETSWTVTHLDDGIKQNVPDIELTMGDIHVLIECKTCTKTPSHIKKEEAWAILQKAADFDHGMHRVTLGKPDFDETAIKKASCAKDITLVDHTLFIEAVLRVISGSLAPRAFIEWLTTKGVAEIERLGGEPSYLSI
jgi:helicase